MSIALQPEFWPLSKIEVAPENPRFGRPVRDVEQLAATIRISGLLQPLIGYVTRKPYADDLCFYAVAGARRIAALQLIHADSDATQVMVKVSVCSQEDAHAAGVIEQTMRVNLHPAEEAAAFAALVDRGQAPADVANAFGQTERFVRQRLKLSSLHAPIFEAFKAGEITLDEAAAYAAGNEDKQKAAWSKLGKDGTVWQIRRHYESGAIEGDSKLALFVGEEAYIKAGGVIDDDLFKDGPGGYWQNPALAEACAIDKLDRRAVELRAEGWSFVDTRIESEDGDYQFDEEQGKPGPIPADQAARHAEVKSRLDALHTQAEKHGNTAAINNEIDDLEEELEAIEAPCIVFSEAQKKRSGVEISIGRGGVFAYRYGLKKIEAPKSAGRGIVAPSRRDASDGPPVAAGAPAEKPEPEARPTNLTHDALTRTAGAIVGLAIIKKPRVALIAMTAHLARARFGFGNLREDWGQTSDSPVAINIAHAPSGASAFDVPEADALIKKLEADYRKMLAPRAKDLETYLAEFTPESGWVEDLFAFLVAPLVRCIETHPENYVNKKRRDIFGAIARLAEADPAAYAPTAEDLKGWNRPALEDFAAEIKFDIPAKTKNAALAEMIAVKAKELQWQPAFLRALLGAPKFKVKKAAPESRTESMPATAKKPKASKAGVKGKAAKADKKGKTESIPKTAAKPALKPGAAGRSGRVFKAAVKIEEASVEITATPKKRGPGRPSNAELAREAAKQAAE